MQELIVENMIEKNSKFYYGLTILISAIIWTAVVWFILNGSIAMFEVDSYYHIRLADIMAKYGLILPSEFPWTDCSVWNNAFFDKEWLFHVVLIAFIKFGEVTGCKIFVLTATFLCAVAWGSLLKTLKIKYLFFALSLMIFASGPAFESRLLMCRPHLLSIILFAIFLVCLVKNKRFLIFTVSCIYALSYTGCWQVVPIAILYDLISNLRRSKESKAWKPWASVYASMGVLAGMIINPYFPSNISGLYVQNIMVLKAAIWGGTTYRLDLGMELYPPALIKIFTIYLPLFILNIIAFISLLENRKTIENFRLKLFFGCLSITYMILTIFVVKFTDYFIPLVSVFLILHFQDRISSWNKRFFFLATLSILLVLFGIYSASVLKKEIYTTTIKYFDSADWISNNSEPTTISLHSQKLIFTSSWDDTPYLFYSLPNFKYLVFLDPYFMYSYSPDKYRMWQKISEGKTSRPAILIQQEFGTNIVFVNKRHIHLQRQLEESGYTKLKFEGKDGEKVFILK